MASWLLVEMHGIVGQAWWYDRCMYALTTDDLHMQFDVIIIISTIHVQFSVYKVNGILEICAAVCHES